MLQWREGGGPRISFGTDTTAGVTAGTKVGELSDVDDLSLDCL